MKIIDILVYLSIPTILIYFIYNILIILYNNYKKIIIKYYSNNVSKINIRNIKYLSKLQYYIYELKKINEKKYNFFSIISIFLISVIFSILTYIISKNILNINSSAFLIAIFSFFIPYLLIQKLYNNQKYKILNNFPIYILNLKNYVYSTNDIIIAFRKATIPSYLNIYINKFNISIEKGMSIVQAFENLKKDININIINDFLDLLLTCHLNGGNVCILLNKYADILTKINVKHAKKLQENLSNIIVFFILIIINIFLIFSFVYSNSRYKEIMTTTFIGKTIINLNILSYITIYYIYIKVNK